MPTLLFLLYSVFPQTQPSTFKPLTALHNESLIKKECTQCGTGLGYMRTQKQTLCKQLAESLEHSATTTHDDTAHIYNNYGLITSLLKEKYSQEDIRQEHRQFIKAAQALKKE